MRALIILLSIRYNVCACHGPVCHYITATAVYLIHFMTHAFKHFIFVFSTPVQVSYELSPEPEAEL